MRWIMKLYDGATTVLIIIGVAALLGVLSARWLGEDNAVEETAEEVIEMHTGVDLDLSPDSKE